MKRLPVKKLIPDARDACRSELAQKPPQQRGTCATDVRDPDFYVGEFGGLLRREPRNRSRAHRDGGRNLSHHNHRNNYDRRDADRVLTLVVE